MVPREGAWQGAFSARGFAASAPAAVKQMLDAVFAFHLFFPFHKSKIVFGFLLLAKIM